MSKRMLPIVALSILLHLSLLLWGGFPARVDQRVQVLPLSVSINLNEPMRAQPPRTKSSAKKPAAPSVQNQPNKAAPVNQAIKAAPQLAAANILAMGQVTAPQSAVPNLPVPNPAPAVQSVADASAKVPSTKESSRSDSDEGVEAIQPAGFNAGYLNNPKPEVPYSARLRCQSGMLKLRVLVSAAGKAIKASIEQASGCDAYDRAAQETVKKDWRFVPAKRGATAIESEVIVPLPLKIVEKE